MSDASDEATLRTVRLAALLRRSVKPSGLPHRDVAIRFANATAVWRAGSGEVITVDERN